METPPCYDVVGVEQAVRPAFLSEWYASEWPLVPALPLCTAASIIRREWAAFSHIMPCLLVLVASIGALVLVAAVLSKFGSGS